MAQTNISISNAKLQITDLINQSIAIHKRLIACLSELSNIATDEQLSNHSENARELWRQVYICKAELQVLLAQIREIKQL